MPDVTDFVFPLTKDLLDITDDYPFIRGLADHYYNTTDELYYTRKNQITGEPEKYLSAYSSFWLKNGSEDFSHHPFFKKVARLFKNTIAHHDYMHVYNYSQITKITGSLASHTDFRTCVLTIPLAGQNNTPCHWYDDEGNEVAVHYYDGPAILKVDVQHGVPENEGVRLFFQIGGFTIEEPFDVLINKIKM